MMIRLEALKQRVDALYAAKTTGRADWADWLHANHVFVVGDYAHDLALRYHANAELTEAAGILHDIADAQMSRFDSQHETESLRLARRLMEECGYDPEEIGLVVDDAIRWHSCHEGRFPRSLVGKVMVTADALAHLRTDFYLFGVWAMAAEKPLAEIKAWVLKKVERDFRDKIRFEEVRQSAQADYDHLKALFSR